MLTPWVSPTPCTCGMDGTHCRLVLLHRSEIRSGSHTLGKTCSPEYQYPQKMTRKWLNPEDIWKVTALLQERVAERAVLMPHSKGALQGHRITNTLSREVHKAVEDVEALLFNTLKTGRAVSLQHVQYGTHFLEKIDKRLSGFSFYQSCTRETTRW